MNPFLINNYEAPEYFCDRQSETKTLTDNIANNSHTAFFAQRRLGKTALIQHVFYLLKKKKQVCIYIDIYATQNLKEFTNHLANAIYQVFPANKSIGKKFLEALKLLRPVISVDSMSGSPELSLDITQPKQFEKTIPQLLKFIDDQNIKAVIAIDEFQQILNYPEKNTEALLRTCVQQMKNVNFIFCGSNQKMMHHIFNSASRPFYASAKNINLKKIDKAIYASFIRKHFEQHKFKISSESLELILDLTCCHTYYTQRLCHEIFINAEKNVKPETVLLVLKSILNDNENMYFQYRNLLTSSQWTLLKAIAEEEKVEQPYSRKFLYGHRIGTPAHVKRGLESLVEKELIFFNVENSQSYFEVNDKFFMHWLSNK
ncbi:MAG: ATP-binding protein [Bacteroidia bacterium]